MSMATIVQVLPTTDAARRTARAVSKAQLQGWLAVGGGLASLPTMAVIAPSCQSSSASELLRRPERHRQVPDLWRKRFAAADVELPAMSEGYVCLIGTVR